jgi:hypothetical protein
MTHPELLPMEAETSETVDVIKKKDYLPIFRMVNKLHYGKSKAFPQIILSPKNPEHQKYVLEDRPFSKFLTFLKIKKSRLMANVKASQRAGDGISRWNKYIQNKYPKCTTKKFQLLHTNGKVERFTSNKYVAVPYDFIQKTIEDRLNAEGISFEKEIKFGGVNGIYKLTNTTSPVEGIAKTISYMNKNDGDRSFKFFGGAVVLVCSNGMVSNNATSEIKLRHLKTEKEVARAINKHIGTILEKLDVLPQKVFALRDIKITRKQAKKHIEALPIPQYMQKAIWKRLFTKSAKSLNGQRDWDETMYGIYMASTYVASNMKKIRKSKNRVAEIEPQHVEQLQNFETITTDYTQKVPIPVAV